MGDHAPAERVFTEFHDGGSWGNTGLSCLVGLATPVWCFIGPDAGGELHGEARITARHSLTVASSYVGRAQRCISATATSDDVGDSAERSPRYHNAH